MKKTSAVLGLLVASSVVASAADLPVRTAPVYVPPPPPPMWTGPYVGLFGGGSFGDPGNSTGGGGNGNKVLYCIDPGGPSNGCFDRPSGYGPFGGPGATSKSSSSSASFAGGAQIGYNFQIDQSFLIGGVADFTWLKRSASRYSESEIRAVDQIYDEQSFYRDSFSQDWLGTARVKAGVVFDNLLVYATGGLAFGNVKSNSSSQTYWYSGAPDVLVATGSGSSSSTAFGWTAGAGLEYRFAPNWTVFAEYLYYSLEDSYSVSVGPVSGTGISFTPASYKVNADASGSLVKVGINYLFWAPPSPVLAPAPVSVRY